MASKLQFPKTEGQPNENFVEKGIVDQVKNLSRPVRELIQNAHDAEAKIIEFYLGDIEVKQIPGIEDYKHSFKKAVEVWGKNSSTENNNVIARIKKCMDDGRVKVLFVTDDGIGLNKARMIKILGTNSSKEEGKGNSGSFGLGHETTFRLSDLQYVLYAGKSNEDGCIVAGEAVLAEHKYNNLTAHRKKGKYVKGIRTGYKFAPPETKEEKHFFNTLDDKKNGSLIAIPGYNGEQNLKKFADEVHKIAAFDFFPLILSKGITVRTGSRLLNHENLGETLEKHKGENRKKRGYTVTGYGVWEAYETFKNGKEFEVDTCAGKVTLKLRKETGADREIHLYRGGMRITNKIPMVGKDEFKDFKNFSALVLVDEKDEQIFELIRSSEPPNHDEIVLDKMTEEKKGNLEKALGEICKKIRGKLDRMPGPGEFRFKNFALIERHKNARRTAYGVRIHLDGSKSGSSEDKNNRRLKRKPDVLKISGNKIVGEIVPEETQKNVSVRITSHVGSDASCNSRQFGGFANIICAKVNGKVVDNVQVSQPHILILDSVNEGEKYNIEIEYEHHLKEAPLEIMFTVARDNE